MNKQHKDQIQQIDMVHRLETILIICGNEIRSAILNFSLIFADYLFIDKWDSGSQLTAECSQMPDWHHGNNYHGY